MVDLTLYLVTSKFPTLIDPMLTGLQHESPIPCQMTMGSGSAARTKPTTPTKAVIRITLINRTAGKGDHIKFVGRFLVISHINLG